MRRGRIVGREVGDPFAREHSLVEHLAQLALDQMDLIVRLPVKRGDLLEVQADERVPMSQRVIDEGERLVFREGDEPERELGKRHRLRILVDAVYTPLRDE